MAIASPFVCGPMVAAQRRKRGEATRRSAYGNSHIGGIGSMARAAEPAQGGDAHALVKHLDRSPGRAHVEPDRGHWHLGPSSRSDRT